MKRIATITRLGPGAGLVLALAVSFVVVPGPGADGQCVGVRGYRATPYASRLGVHGRRYAGDHFTRPRPSRLSFSRERQLGRRGNLSLYPGPAGSPHRGRLFNDYAAYPTEPRSRRYPPALPNAPRAPQPDAPPPDSLGAPAGSYPRGAAPPSVIVDPSRPRDRQRGLPRADAQREGGWTLLASGETVRALGRFAGRIAITGSDAEARVGYALAAALYGDDAAAEDAMQIALKIDPCVLHAVDVGEKLASRLTALADRYERDGDPDVMTASLSILLDAGDEPILAAK